MLVTPRVFNKRGPHPPRAVLVDRTTDFGNPFKIGEHGNRQDVIEKYEFWIFQPEQLALRERMIRELKGQDLLCWCAPDACHADIILSIANAD